MQRVATPKMTGPCTAAYEEWPLEIRALFAALSRPAAQFSERRDGIREDYRIQATLWIHGKSRKQAATAATVYLRDYIDKCISFVSDVLVRHDQKLELEVLLNDGTLRRVHCQAVRCRQFRESWFEGLLRFAR